MAACGLRKKSGDDDEKGADDGCFVAVNPTVKAAEDFDAETDAKILRKAMKGFGTDESAIIEVVANRTAAQMAQVKANFKTSFGRDLIKDLESELSGDIEKAVVARCQGGLAQMNAWFCHKAMKGAGTDEKALIDILCTKTNAEMKLIKKAYKDMYDKDLEKVVSGETSGHLKRVLVGCMSANRADTADEDKAAKDAKDLKEAGVDAWGTDESAFNLVMCSRSYAHIMLVKKAYKKLASETLEKSIEKEFSGDIERALL